MKEVWIITYSIPNSNKMLKYETMAEDIYEANNKFRKTVPYLTRIETIGQQSEYVK